ncbi:MAG: hypothetical protein AABW58_02210 [Nanoarchaeota archaeon]
MTVTIKIYFDKEIGSFYVEAEKNKTDLVKIIGIDDYQIPHAVLRIFQTRQCLNDKYELTISKQARAKIKEDKIFGLESLVRVQNFLVPPKKVPAEV